LVNSATSISCGAVEVDVNPGDTGVGIVTTTLKSLANVRSNFWDPNSNARRTILWYNRFASKTPLVSLNANEHDDDAGAFANIASAARTLSEKYGIRVIVVGEELLIVGSPNSLHAMLLDTGRWHNLELSPMSKGMIHKLPQIQSLRDTLDLSKLDDVVWNVLGGIPTKHVQLSTKLKRLKEQRDPFLIVGVAAADVRHVIVKFVCNERHPG
jgi:hypothetical protein